MAWATGDVPGDLDFNCTPDQVVVAGITEIVEEHLPGLIPDDARWRTLQTNDGPVGRYRVEASDHSWFVRVTTRLGDSRLERKLTDHLHDQGVLVNRLLLAGAIMEWMGHKYRVDVRPFVGGHHFEGSLRELSSLGTTLAACHDTLSGFPYSQKVKNSAQKRESELESTRRLIYEALSTGQLSIFAERESWAVSHQGWLGEMVENLRCDLSGLPGARCLHGEITPANVLFTRDQSQAVLLDFEEGVHIFAPIDWDIAYFVQRFCMTDDPSTSVLRRRLDAIEDGYGRTLPKVAESMRQAAWTAIVVMVGLRISHGVETPITEWDKFYRLERQAVSYRGKV